MQPQTFIIIIEKCINCDFAHLVDLDVHSLRIQPNCYKHNHITQS